MKILPAVAKLSCLLALLPIAVVSCKPKEIQALLRPADALGVVLARETAKTVGTRKQVVVITADARWGPVSTAEETFNATLKKQGISIVATHASNLGDPMKLGGVGLKPADFFDAVEKFPDVGAIVSFAGVPLLRSADVARLPSHYPPVLAVATATLGIKPGVPNNRAMVARMVEANWIQLAIIDGSEQIPEQAGKVDPTQELFAQHFQILRSPKSNSP